MWRGGVVVAVMMMVDGGWINESGWRRHVLRA